MILATMIHSGNITEPTVSVIVPNYNGGKLAVRCVASLLETEYENMKILFVDNCSTDNSRAEIVNRFGEDPRLGIIALDRNHSFTGAIEIGFLADQSDYVVLMNNDTVADRAWLRELVRVYSNDPAIGAVQAKLLRMDDSAILQYGGGLLNRLVFMRGRGVGEPERLYSSNDRIFFAAGACMLTSRKVLTEVGLPDTSFLMYDDADLGWRIRLRGYEIIFVPTSRVIHRGSVTLARSEFEEKVISQSVYEHYAMILKNYSLRMIIVTLPWVLLWYFARATAYGVRGKIRFAKSVLVGTMRLLRELRAIWGKRMYIQGQIRRVSDSRIVSLMEELGGDPMVIDESGVMSRLGFQILSHGGGMILRTSPNRA